MGRWVEYMGIKRIGCHQGSLGIYLYWKENQRPAADGYIQTFFASLDGHHGPGKLTPSI